MNEERLLKGAEILEADAAKPDGISFDLGCWGRLRNPYVPEPKTLKDFPLNCDTAGCALGLFALSGAFDGTGFGAKVIDRTGLLPTYTSGGTESRGYVAAMELFGITASDAQYLFSPDAYTGETRGADAELEVAARIRKFVAEGGFPFNR